MGIRPDDVQYIELYNEYNKLQTNGEKVSYKATGRKFLVDNQKNIWHQ